MRTGRRIAMTAVAILALASVHAGILQAAEGKTLRSQVLEVLEERFSEDFTALRGEYGMRRFVPEDQGQTGEERVGRRVILVHGLDDPGLIWRDLAPALAGQGFRVFIMSYPNDQPIRDSAKFFFRELEEFAAREGSAPVAIIAHSMGGLVTREMSPCPALGYAGAEEAGRVPPLSHFIMIGTPNHGSVFSRLRLLTELRDQMVVGAERGFHWLRPIVDGLGEAAGDLYPGSEFLTTLNSRPLPNAGRMLAIAGVMSPYPPEEAARKGWGDVQPPPNLEAFAAKMADRVGDGLVPVESVRLPGVPLVQVRGTHVTIIRNLGGKRGHVPSAIPVVLAELEGGEP